MYKVMKTFVCICVNAHLKLLDTFCYLGDMFTVARNADAAVQTRIRIGWNKFSRLVPLLRNADISLIVRGRLIHLSALMLFTGRQEGHPACKK